MLLNISIYRFCTTIILYNYFPEYTVNKILDLSLYYILFFLIFSRFTESSLNSALLYFQQLYCGNVPLTYPYLFIYCFYHRALYTLLLTPKEIFPFSCVV
jgi:hypothetical protein